MELNVWSGNRSASATKISRRWLSGKINIPSICTRTVSEWMHNYSESSITANTMRSNVRTEKLLRTMSPCRLKRLNRNSSDSLSLSEFCAHRDPYFFFFIFAVVVVDIVHTRPTPHSHIHFAHELSLCLIYVDPEVHIFTTFYHRKVFCRRRRRRFSLFFLFPITDALRNQSVFFLRLCGAWCVWGLLVLCVCVQ